MQHVSALPHLTVEVLAEEVGDIRFVVDAKMLTLMLSFPRPDAGVAAA
jgi:hypothetical protein